MAYELDRRGFLGLSAAVFGSELLAACGGRREQSQQIKAERANITGPSGSPVRGGTLTFSDTEAVPSPEKSLHKGAYVIAYFEKAQTLGASPNVHVTFQTQSYPDFYNAWKKPGAKA